MKICLDVRSRQCACLIGGRNEILTSTNASPVTFCDASFALKQSTDHKSMGERRIVPKLFLPDVNHDVGGCRFVPFKIPRRREIMISGVKETVIFSLQF